jgi:hypothetical protein
LSEFDAIEEPAELFREQLRIKVKQKISDKRSSYHLVGLEL